MKREKVLASRPSVGWRRWSRREFLKMGGAGLAGATLLGAAGCGGGGQQGGGPAKIIFSFGPDETGTLQEIVDRFNQQNEGEIEV
ncbi:MAG: hypothetical protein M3N10_08200, partial [Actinomycetota bacterium]|nr:hypothetical protein [Actinomycetota bacterium]